MSCLFFNRFFHRAGSRKWTNHAPQQPQQRSEIRTGGDPKAPSQRQHVEWLHVSKK